MIRLTRCYSLTCLGEEGMTEGDRIRLIRLAKGMNQVEFAQAVDMPASAVCHLENGSREVTESM